MILFGVCIFSYMMGEFLQILEAYLEFEKPLDLGD